MKRFLRFLAAAIGLGSGCSKPTALSPAEFTQEFAVALRAAKPGIKVVVAQNLELTVTSASGATAASFLSNAYDTYRQDPKEKAGVIVRFVASNVETIQGIREGVDRTQIVPVIKDRPWFGEIKQTLARKDSKEIPEYLHEDFNADLVVFYAEDSPKNIRYLVPNDLAVSKIEQKELRALACKNLLRLLPKIERHGANGLYMITAGGDYEASLLLIDSIWSDGQLKVKGETVVAIPSRDMLLVTGSEDSAGIARLQEMVKKASAGAYRLTPKLFVYRGGKFEEFLP